MHPKRFFTCILRQTEFCHGLWTGPYLSLRKMSIFVTVATKVASTKWVIEHHPCFFAINFQKNPEKYIKPSKKIAAVILWVWNHWCQVQDVQERISQRGEQYRILCVLFHRSTVDLHFPIPHKRFHHGVTPNFPFSSPILPFLTNTFGNSLATSSTSLKERAQLWQHSQAPMIAPSYPHFYQMTALSNTAANQLITATIGN